MSLAAQMDSATLNESAFSTSPEVPRREAPAAVADNKPKVILPSAAEIPLANRAPRQVASTKPLLEPKAWGGVAALADDGDNSPSLFGRAGNAPTAAPKETTKPAAAAPTKGEAPAILPAHELARAARSSKEQTGPVTSAPAQQWGGVSSYSEHAINVNAHVPSPEVPRRAGRSSKEGRDEEDVDGIAKTKIAVDAVESLNSIPSSREMGPAAAASATAKKNAYPVDALPTMHWGGVSAMADENFGPKFETSPQSRRVNASESPNTNEASKIPSSAEIYGNSRVLGGTNASNRPGSSTAKNTTPRRNSAFDIASARLGGPPSASSSARRHSSGTIHGPKPVKTYAPSAAPAAAPKWTGVSAGFDIS